MAKILFTTIMYNRPKVSELYLLGLERLKSVADFDVLVVVSDDASAELCKRYGVEYYYHENLPLGKKHNFMLEKCFEKDFDYLIHSGDDDVMSNRLFMDYCLLFDTFEHDYIKAHGLYFYDLKSGKALNFQPKNTFGAFRAFKRNMLENVAVQCHCVFRQDILIGGKTYHYGNIYSLPKYVAKYYNEKVLCSIDYQFINLWGDDLNKTLDFSSESKLIESNIKMHIVKHDTPQIIDFKSEQNIWKFEKYYTSSTDATKEEILNMLSEKEVAIISNFANC
jgi:hypothetical protein